MSLYRSGVGASWRERQAALLLPFLPRLAVAFPCLADALPGALAGALARVVAALEPLLAADFEWAEAAFAPPLECEALLVALLGGFFASVFCAGRFTASAQLRPAIAAIRKIKSPQKSKGAD